MRNDKNNLIVELSFEVALKINEFSERLRRLKKHEMSTQLFKSGASIRTSTRDAQNAESISGFIQKIKISAKEAAETQYWLLLCKASKYYPTPEEKMLHELDSIIKITSKIILSSKSSKFSN